MIQLRNKRHLSLKVRTTVISAFYKRRIFNNGEIIIATWEVTNSWIFHTYKMPKSFLLPKGNLYPFLYYASDFVWQYAKQHLALSARDFDTNLIFASERAQPSSVTISQCLLSHVSSLLRWGRECTTRFVVNFLVYSFIPLYTNEPFSCMSESRS
jgi:hypothetical protein